GSSLIASHSSRVDLPVLSAVQALPVATVTAQGLNASSERLRALRFPPTSTIAIVAASPSRSQAAWMRAMMRSHSIREIEREATDFDIRAPVADRHQWACDDRNPTIFSSHQCRYVIALRHCLRSEYASD